MLDTLLNLSLFAQNDFGDPGPPPEAALGIIFAILFVGLAIGLAIGAFIAYVISNVIKRIPEQYRQDVQPGQAYFILIPLFNIVWNFMLYPRISKSLKAYFDANGRNDVGDCGEQVGLWYAICTACCVIPCVNYLAGPASLVLFIIYLVKVIGLKNQIPEGAA